MVTAVNLTSGSTGASTSTVTTASVSPSANKLQLLAVNSRNFTGSAPPAPTVTGCGLTWVQVTNIQYDTGPTSLKRVTLFRAMGASPTTGTLSIDFAGDSQTDVCWSLDEFTGMDTSGTNGSGAIVQTVTAKDETGSATSITATLAAFASASNATYGAFAHVAPTNGQTASAGSGFTALASPVDTTIGLIAEFKTTNDTTVDGSISGVSYELGMIAVEIAAASSGVTAALTGVSETSAVGNVAPSTSKALTGNAATGSPGTVAPVTSKALAGNAATGQVGTIAQSRTVALTGNSSTGQVGTVTPDQSAIVALTGVPGSGQAGNVSPAAVIALTGVSGGGQAGLVTASPSKALAGNQSTGSVGNLGKATTVALTSTAAVGEVGNVGVAGDLTVALTGVQANTDVGSVSLRSVGGGYEDDRKRRRIKYRNLWLNEEELEQVLALEIEDEVEKTVAPRPKKKKAKPVQVKTDLYVQKKAAEVVAERVQKTATVDVQAVLDAVIRRIADEIDDEESILLLL